VWTWLEKFLELMSRYGCPLVAAALFLVIIPLALRGLWREYRRLSERHHELLSETARLMELSAAEAEIARQTISVALHRIAEIRKKLDDLIDALNSNNDPNHKSQTK
jgi:recombinational DNA repair ATPase RecF